MVAASVGDSIAGASVGAAVAGGWVGASAAGAQAASKSESNTRIGTIKSNLFFFIVFSFDRMNLRPFRLRAGLLLNSI
jgi:hypothetical protein